MVVRLHLSTHFKLIFYVEFESIAEVSHITSSSRSKERQSRAVCSSTITTILTPHTSCLLFICPSKVLHCASLKLLSLVFLFPGYSKMTTSKITAQSLKSIPTSFATVSVGTPSDDLEPKLKAISSANFQAIELGFPDLVTFASKHCGHEIKENDYDSLCTAASEVKKLCEKYALKIMMLQPFSNFEGWPKGSTEREDTFERARGWVRIMEACGTDMLQVGSSDSEGILGDIEVLAGDLGELADMLAPKGFRIAYENWCWATHAVRSCPSLSRLRKNSNKLIQYIALTAHLGRCLEHRPKSQPPQPRSLPRHLSNRRWRVCRSNNLLRPNRKLRTTPKTRDELQTFMLIVISNRPSRQDLPPPNLRRIQISRALQE